jgi:hypothetical protein
VAVEQQLTVAPDGFLWVYSPLAARADDRWAFYVLYSAIKTEDDVLARLDSDSTRDAAG